MPQPIPRRELLRQRLDDLVSTFDVSTITPDPLELVLRYQIPEDQEVVGLLAAAFAYGRADLVVRNVSGVLVKIGSSPHRYLRDEFDVSEASSRFAGFSHRFQKTPELVALLRRISNAIRAHGSLGKLFEATHVKADETVRDSLQRFVEALIGPPYPDESLQVTRGLRYLLSSPADGSACKRMNLYLRWMVRTTSPDLGLWRFVDPASLIMPLDTHIQRITTFLGLNRRKSTDWRTAEALTAALRRLDRSDPVKYDFAICRLGILSLCSRKRERSQCEVCLLNDVCRLRKR